MFMYGIKVGVMLVLGVGFSFSSGESYGCSYLKLVLGVCLE
jgi:hypothetical protein